MVDFVVFNELSLPIPHQRSKEIIVTFLQLVEELAKHNITTVRTSIPVCNYQFTEEADIKQYIYSCTDRELKTMLLSFYGNKMISLKEPIVDTHETIQLDQMLVSEYLYNSKACQSLGFSDIWGTVAISYQTQVCWCSPIITVQCNQLDENLVITKDVIIKHASIKNHLLDHKDLLFNKKYGVTPNEFWCNRTNFSKLVLCMEVEEQLKVLPAYIFSAMRSKLIDIDAGIKQVHQYKNSPESESVKHNPKLNKLRFATRPDGTKINCTYHLKGLPDGYRIHYAEEKNLIFICYMGKHLKTKKY